MSKILYPWEVDPFWEVMGGSKSRYSEGKVKKEPEKLSSENLPQWSLSFQL